MWTGQSQARQTRPHVQYAVDQVWWWHIFHTLVIAKGTSLKCRRHRRLRWRMPMNLDNYENNFKQFRQPKLQHLLQGHLPSRRQ